MIMEEHVKYDMMRENFFELSFKLYILSQVQTL